MEVEGILKFVKFIHRFQGIERVMWLKGRDHPENDVEHSYQLAMVAWYIISVYKLPLNVDKAMKYALLHDLVEAYAGDVDAFDKNPNRDEIKAKKEHEVLLKIKSEFAEFPEMAEIISRYELRDEEESNFIYSLDKILGALNVYLDEGRTWKKQNITFELEKEVILKKLNEEAHPEVKKYFDQLVTILEKEQHLFHQGDV